MNNIIIIGRLVRDPELRYIPNSGAAVCNFTLAVDRQYSKAKKEEMEAKNEQTADFIRVNVWNKAAEMAAQYLAQGRLVAVQGRIQTGQYQDKDGKTVFTTDVVANNVEFLEWGDKQNNNSNNNNNNNNNYNQQGSDFSDIDGFSPTSNDDIPF